MRDERNQNRGGSRQRKVFIIDWNRAVNKVVSGARKRRKRCPRERNGDVEKAVNSG